MKMGRKLEEQAGKVYNNIEVIRHDGVRRGRNYWLCKCHCGKLFTTLVASLKTGSTKSCGCYRDKLCIFGPMGLNLLLQQLNYYRSVQCNFDCWQ